MKVTYEIKKVSNGYVLIITREETGALTITASTKNQRSLAG